MSTISAGTTSTTALVQTGDTTGSLVLQTGATPTTAMTVSSSQIVNFANAPTVGGNPLPSGAMTLISTLTASSSTSLAWTGLSGYDKYLLVFENLVNATNGTFVACQIGTGSTTYISSNYAQYGTFIYQPSATAGLIKGTANGVITLAGNSGNGFNSGQSGCSGEILFSSMTNSGYTSFSGFSIGQIDSSVYYYEQNEFSGVVANTTAKTAIKIYMYSGNITSGSASLYGISS